MAGHEPSPVRFAVRAAFLVVPAVLVAVAAPRVLERLRKPGAIEQVKGLDPAGVAAITGRSIDAATGAAKPAGKDPAAPTGDVAPRAPEKATLVQEAAAARADADLKKAQATWEKVTLIAPREARAGAPERFPFDGFALSVESVPEGATVTVNGKPYGPTPVMSSIACPAGQKLQVRVEHPKHAAREETVECGVNELVKLVVKLGGK